VGHEGAIGEGVNMSVALVHGAHIKGERGVEPSTALPPVCDRSKRIRELQDNGSRAHGCALRTLLCGNATHTEDSFKYVIESLDPGTML
jgi:hypothetical protein